MRVTVFCEAIDILVSEVPGTGIEIRFYESEESAPSFVIGYDKARELVKALKFLNKNNSFGEVLF